jgi:putative flippase GtrA
MVQVIALAFLLNVVGMHYLLATAVAVEISVLHNFVWHRKWTWADRKQPNAARMLVRFNLTSGALSLAGNLISMFVLVSAVKLNAWAASLLAIAVCALVNFILSDRLVFV